MAFNALLNASSRVTVAIDARGTKNGAVAAALAAPVSAKEGSCVGTKVSKLSGTESGSTSPSSPCAWGTYFERGLGLLVPGCGVYGLLYHLVDDERSQPLVDRDGEDE